MNLDFWKGKKVLITGHTGFKGSWLSFWLWKLGAKVVGYSLEPPTNPNLYSLLSLDELITSKIADIRDFVSLESYVHEQKPDIVFHLAAQSLVKYSYLNPLETFTTNVIGTVNILESIRKSNTIKSAVIVTSDKCYEESNQNVGYVETDRIGGYDPYSSSKGCAEIVTSAYIRSYFQNRSDPSVASARAGNVIGGGDWGKDRLLPDIMRNLFDDDNLVIRNPNSIRPWQHVLDPLNGYLKLAEKLWDCGDDFQGGWNFGPDENDALSVSELITLIHRNWGIKSKWKYTPQQQHESNKLLLICSKSHEQLAWWPVLELSDAVKLTTEWYQAYKNQKDIPSITNSQIDYFMSSKNENL